MFIAIWLGVAGGIALAFRKVGPWWRVGLGSLVWPALPAIAGISKYNHARKRRARCSKTPS